MLEPSCILKFQQVNKISILLWIVPTDYLFDYNYLGQFESTGIFSQQLIIAEGGFKSKLDTAFANEWLTSINASASIWKYIQAYGDVGLLKNKGNKPIFVYDAGIRLNLITDYFEIFFPSIQT